MGVPLPRACSPRPPEPLQTSLSLGTLHRVTGLLSASLPRPWPASGRRPHPSLSVAWSLAHAGVLLLADVYVMLACTGF